MVEIIDDGGELFLCLLVEVRDCNASSKNSIVGMGNSHVGSCLCSLRKIISYRSLKRLYDGRAHQIVQLHSRDALVNT